MQKQRLGIKMLSMQMPQEGLLPNDDAVKDLHPSEKYGKPNISWETFIIYMIKNRKPCPTKAWIIANTRSNSKAAATGGDKMLLPTMQIELVGSA